MKESPFQIENHPKPDSQDRSVRLSMENESEESKRRDKLDTQINAIVSSKPDLPDAELLERLWANPPSRETPSFLKSKSEVLDLLANPENKGFSTENLEEKDISSMVEQLICEDSTTENNVYIKRIGSWIGKNSESSQSFIQREISKNIKKKKELSLTTFALLGEISNEPNFRLENDLVLTIETSIKNALLTTKLNNQLAILNRLNDSQGNILLLKIFDYLENHLFVLQNDLRDDLGEANHKFYLSFHNFFLRKEVRNSKNYLVQKRFQDLVESLEQFQHLNKPDAIPGVAGGTSDMMIYEFKKRNESYENRLGIGLNEGYPVGTPLIPIAPGYLGMYKNGKLAKIYPAPKDPQEIQEEARKKEEFYISQNDPKYDYIYAEINTPSQFEIAHPDPSNKLHRLYVLDAFERRLKEDGASFFIDRSRVKMEDLHPVVATKILTINRDYIYTKESADNDPSPAETEELQKKLFPDEGSDEKFYGYLNLVQLHMRKKLVDDFGIEISDYDFATQRNFLEFLETRDIENITPLKKFVKKFRSGGIRTFLSLEQDFSMGEKILSLGERLPQETADAIFKKYAEIVDETEKVENYLEENFDQKKPNGSLTQSIRENLLRRAKDLLVYFADNLDELKPEDIISRLSDMKSEVLLMASTFQEVRKNNPEITLEDMKNLNLEEIAATQISEKDKEQMLRIFLSNRTNNPDYTPELLEEVRQEFEKAFKKADSTFYILKEKENIISFIRFDKLDPDTLYAASFNVRSEGRQSGIGKSMMKITLDKKAESFNLAAVAFSENPALRMYQEDFGFEIIGKDENYKDTGKTFYKLLRKRISELPLAA